MPAWQLGQRTRKWALPACLLFFALIGAGHSLGQQPKGLAESSQENFSMGQAGTSVDSGGADSAGTRIAPEMSDRWLGVPVREIAFEGVPLDRLKPLAGHLPQAVDAPLSRENVAESLRQLYATGLFSTIEAEAIRQSDGVRLLFKGTPRMFIGTVSVNGAKGSSMNTQLERAAHLNAGTRFTQRRLNTAIENMKQALADNGFNQPEIHYKLTTHPEEQLIDITFEVVSGVQARVGGVEVSGDSGLTADEFKRQTHLRTGTRVTHDTSGRALSSVLKHYQRQDRLEADVKLESEVYIPQTNRITYSFSANRGPVVKVLVEGAKISPDRLKRLVPVFEEGTVDEDLLNEGNRRLRDYFQRLGYFNVRVDHHEQNPDSSTVTIIYSVKLGSRSRVEHVSVTGNHYFDSEALQQLLTVRAADYLDRHGTYSQALVAADVSSLETVYHNNGFSNVKVTPETVSNNDSGSPARSGRKAALPISVIYHIDEGQQQHVGELKLEGAEKSDTNRLLGLMNTSPGQLFSPQNLAGDRDALLTDYLSRGFDQVQIEVDDQTEAADPTKVDVVFHIHEGQQIFLRKILLSGLHYTRQDTVEKAFTLHAGDPLNQSALTETQRNLYEYALFNEVNTAVQNPNGGEPYKTVLLQMTEARRWTLTYGLGFEAQTGQPQNNCASLQARGSACSPNGRPGVSPRVLFDITRNNLFGRDQSASIRTTYGLLEQNINLLFQNPRFLGNRDLGFTFSGGYANSQDVTTYVASKLEAGLRWTEHFTQPGEWLSKANTLIYAFDFRRVKVAESSLQVNPDEIQALATATRVGGPSMTWIRDTRDSAVDSHRGTYSSFQEFLSNKYFGAEAQFNRLDLSNSSYFGFDKNRYVLARNTRYGQERAYGPPDATLLPLPERLYAGGATSHRGFPINDAGPRDPETGFPIGGAGALVNSTELRLPPPILPFFGDSLSFVLFHDMGNVFTNAGDAWISALRIHQPDRDACKVLTPPDYSTDPPTPPSPDGPDTSTGRQGQCNFNYFSHAAGLGLRYHTPVGPIRLDFSYNLNPPIYPVNIDYSKTDIYSNQHVGEATHFNFFFSLGQTF